MKNLNVEDNIYKAKIQLYDTFPMMSYLVTYLKCVPADVKTFMVDHNGIMYYSEKFARDLSSQDMKYIICHEVMHIVLGHCFRLHKAKYQTLRQIAMDILVNALLEEAGMKKAPAGGVLIEGNAFTFWEGLGEMPPGQQDKFLASKAGRKVMFCIDNVTKRTVEEIYDILSREVPPSMRDDLPFTLDFVAEGISDAEGVKAEEVELIQQEWRMRLSEAVVIARQRGKLPGGFGSVVEAILAPKENWKERLFRYVMDMIPMNMTWARPSPRYRALGVYLPDMDKGHRLEVVIHGDSSGSITNRTFGIFLSHMMDILQSFEDIHVTLIVCDAAIQGVFELDKEDSHVLERFKVKGRGGTSHSPVVNWIRDNKPDAKVLISLTDGESDIERCYGKLPDSCGRLIVLNNGRRAESLSEFGEVLVLPDNFDK